MLDWLRLLLMVFYAPSRAMQEVRDRGALVPAGVLALLVYGPFLFYIGLPFIRLFLNPYRPLSMVTVLLESVGLLLFIALVFVPLVIILCNMFERRGSIRLVIQQEYSAFASTAFYSW